MATYGFDEQSVKRIGKTVRLSEKFPQKVKLGGPDRGGANPGVRMMLAKFAGTAWQAGSTAIVTVYAGDVGSVATAGTVVAYNHFIKFSSQTNCTNKWITLGHNGFHWHPTEIASDCGTCMSAAGGIDFHAISGFAHTAVQVLGHDSGGCVKWYDVISCESTAA